MSLVIKDLPPYRMELTRARRASLHQSYVMPLLLFHYTTVKSMFKIIAPKDPTGPVTLWASSAFCMNDADEIKHGIKVVHEVAKEFLPEALVNHWFALTPETEEYTLLRFLEHTCVTCFCSEPDLLSQWRIYGKSGDGYAIGFKSVKLIEAALAKSFDLVPVIYDSEKQKSVLRHFFSSARELRKSPALAIDDVFNIATLDEAVKLSLSFKNSSFHEEKEWRLISAFPNTKLLYREGPRYVVPYVEIHLDRTSIGEIWLGPTLEKDLAKRTLDMYIRQNYGMDASGQQAVNVRASAIPLRSV